MSRTGGRASAVVCGLVVALAGCGGSSSSDRPDPSATGAEGQPRMGEPRLVDTRAKGRRGKVVVSVPVSYRVSRKRPARHRVERLRAVVRVKDASGRQRRLEAAPEVPGGRLHTPPVGRKTVTATLPLSSADAATVRRAVNGGGSAAVEAHASVASPSDRDGGSPVRTPLRATARIAALSAPASEARRVGANLTLDRSGDACGHMIVGPFEPCVNQSGGTWKAPHFLASHTFAIDCAKGYYPAYQIPLLMGGAPAYSIKTKSAHFTSGSSFTSGPQLVTVTDYNPTGHPVLYEGVLACCEYTGRKCSEYGATRDPSAEPLRKPNEDG